MWLLIYNLWLIVRTYIDMEFEEYILLDISSLCQNAYKNKFNLLLIMKKVLTEEVNLSLTLEYV